VAVNPFFEMSNGEMRGGGEIPKSLTWSIYEKKNLYRPFSLMAAQPYFAGQYLVLKVVDGDTIDINYSCTKVCLMTKTGLL